MNGIMVMIAWVGIILAFFVLIDKAFIAFGL